MTRDNAEGVWHIEVDSLETRTVTRADMLLIVGPFHHGDTGPFSARGDGRAIALDAATHEFVLVPGLPELWQSECMSLSDDGALIVGRSRSYDLFVHDVVTGKNRWFNRDDIDGHVMGTFSPDRRFLAALAMVETGTAADEGPHRIAIELVGLDSDAVRTLWRGEGYWAECSLSWSPNGRLLVASYLTLAGINATLVLEAATGQVVATMEDRVPATNPHDVWIAGDELVAFPEVDDGIAIIHVDADTATSRERLYREGLPHGFVGRGGKRYVQPAVYPLGQEVTELYTANHDDTDRRLFVTISMKAAVHLVDMPSGVDRG